MPEQEDTIRTTQPLPAAQVGGQIGGVPVGVTGNVNADASNGSDPKEPDPAEAEFERLTGHPVGEGRSAEGDEPRG